MLMLLKIDIIGFKFNNGLKFHIQKCSKYLMSKIWQVLQFKITSRFTWQFQQTQFSILSRLWFNKKGRKRENRSNESFFRTSEIESESVWTLGHIFKKKIFVRQAVRDGNEVVGDKEQIEWTNCRYFIIKDLA